MKAHQNKKKNTFKAIFILSLISLTSLSFSEVSIYQTGPVTDHTWAPGAFDVANYPTRIRWTEDPPMGGGRFNIHFSCTSTEEFNEMLQLFGLIEADRLELVINGTTGIETHWKFRIWDEERWALNMKLAEPTSPLFLPSTLRPVPAPRIDVYDAGDCLISWPDVIVPPQITVIDTRTGPINLRTEVNRLRYEVAALRAELAQLRELVALLLEQIGR